MKKLLVLALVTAVSAVLAIPALAATKTVRVGDNWFVKRGAAPTISIKRNDTINFRWVGNAPHNVVVTSGPQRFRSSVQTRGSYRKKFTRRGTYRILCTIHAPEMRATVRVR